MHSDTLPALNVTDQIQHYEARVTLGNLVNGCLGSTSLLAILKYFC
ncbi:MAG: hypothetical protein ACI8R9_002146 [Paraglaciecola sp.]|jgi:hypothetical protein